VRIAFLGNTNNYPFALALALRDLGHDVLLLVDQTSPLHRPESRRAETADAYGQWVRDVSPVRARDVVLPTRRRRSIVRLLKSADALVLNGFGPAFWHHVRAPSLVILTGSDLETYADEGKLRSFLRQSRRRGFAGVIDRIRHSVIARIAALQREGIASAAAVEYSFPGMLPEGDALLDGLGVTPERRRCFFLTDLDLLRAVPPPHNAVFRIFSASRLNWVRPMPAGSSTLDQKGTDVMLRGVARFRERVGRPFELRLVKKGLHVRETLALAGELGLDDCITWLEEMPLRDVYAEFTAADVVLDHFGSGSIGVAARDAMALGRPVIANAKPAIFARHLGAPSPILHAETEDDVATHLASLAGDRALRERLSVEGRRFAEAHFEPHAAARDVVATLSSAPGGRA
jgi:glycosyltransferase involved in cell wall biosynthesis